MIQRKESSKSTLQINYLFLSFYYNYIVILPHSIFHKKYLLSQARIF